MTKGPLSVNPNIIGHGAIESRSASLLGFHDVLAQVAEYCAGEEGQRQVLSSQIHIDPGVVESERAPSVELRRLLDSGFRPPELDLPEIGTLLGRLRRGAPVLDPVELAAVGRLAATTEAIRRSFLELENPDEHPALNSLGTDLPPLGTLVNEVRRIVSVDGTIQDQAVPELARVKRDLRRLQIEIETSANQLMTEPSLRRCFNGTVPTQRGGRTVVPLKAAYRTRVPGVVHEVSASGATLYIEPLSDVEANNAVVAARDRYASEVRRVLLELTASVAQQEPDLQRATECAGRYDCVQARARYAQANTASVAEIGPLVLRRARHPELGDQAVPLDLSMTADARIMVITGPNTGGKTVCLKTVGLLCLMNQAGMEIPAANDSTLPIYDGIYADIGDEQSISSSLSTFSAHIENLSTIMRNANKNSLVLIDELGTGTDPEEGIALSRALLDLFREAGTTVIVTTHHGALKVYAYTEPGVTNVSMEFNSRTLRPTYRIVEGVPGESHAIDIAQRHRMPEAVIENATRLLDTGRTESGRIINELTRRQLEQDIEEKDLQVRATELAVRETELAEDRAEFRRQEREHRLQTVSELGRFLADSRRDIERAIRAVRASGGARLAGKTDAEEQAAYEVDAAARASPAVVEQRLQVEREALAEIEASEFDCAPEGVVLAPGSSVRIRRTGAAGRVVRRHRPDRYPDRYVVQTETIRGEFRAVDLEMMSEVHETTPGHARVELVTASEPVLELHVRGMRAEEALQNVERQLNAAVIRGWSEFSIVHGRGQGVLRQIIREYLRDSAAVSDYEDAPANEGGHGKTIVRLHR